METIVNAPTGGMFTGGGGGEYPAVGSGTSMNTKASVAFEQQPHGPMMQPQHMNPQLQQMQYTQHQQHIIGQQPNVYQVVQYLIFQFFLFFFLFFDLMAGLFPFLHRLTCNIFIWVAFLATGRNVPTSFTSLQRTAVGAELTDKSQELRRGGDRSRV